MVVFPGDLGWFLRTPNSQSFLGSNIFRTQISISITLLYILAVDIGSTDLNHLKVDVPIPDVDLRHGAPIAVPDLGFQGYGLALDQLVTSSIRLIFMDIITRISLKVSVGSLSLYRCGVKFFLYRSAIVSFSIDEGFNYLAIDFYCIGCA